MITRKDIVMFLLGLAIFALPGGAIAAKRCLNNNKIALFIGRILLKISVVRKGYQIYQELLAMVYSWLNRAWLYTKETRTMLLEPTRFERRGAKPQI